MTPSLATGASRSRRYAASAAFIASSAMFSCGEGSSADPGLNTGGASAGQSQGGRGGESQKSTGGSTQSGGTGTKQGDGGADGGAEQGDAGATQINAGGAEDRGGASSEGGEGGAAESTGGAVSTGGAQANGGTQAKGGSGGAAPTGRACEGFQERGSCRTSADCPSQSGAIGPPMCLLNPPQSGCPANPAFLPSCPEEGCGDGEVCAPITCGAECQPVCDEATCTGEYHCVGVSCELKPCELDGARACPDSYVCDETATDYPTHCVPVSCHDGTECQSFQECGSGAPLDAHACGSKTCTADADCGDCGYCVGEQCQPTLGTCYQNLAMPYGCVWPDEELI